MQQIIPKIIQNPKPIDIKEACTRLDTNPAQHYVCYRTNSSIGIGVLIRHSGSKDFGFIYHTELLKGNSDNLKYRAEFRRQAIEKACENREVFYCDYAELLELCAKHTKL
jgi:hypothetical protein